MEFLFLVGSCENSNLLMPRILVWHPKSSGKLDVALDVAASRGWVLVDMAEDWKTFFEFTGD